MDIRGIRKANYVRLLQEFQENRERDGQPFILREFAEAYELSPMVASQLKSGFRGIGDVIARRLEKLHKPPRPTGWMDCEHAGVEPDAVEEAAKYHFMMLYRENPEVAMRVLSQITKKRRNNSR